MAWVERHKQCPKDTGGPAPAVTGFKTAAAAALTAAAAATTVTADNKRSAAAAKKAVAPIAAVVTSYCKASRAMLPTAAAL
jgi:hypothetical protein